jgi:phage shock protein E
LKNILYIVLAALSFASCNGQQKKGVEKVPPAVFEKQVTEHKGQLIDVRTTKEFETGHLADATHMHIYDADFSRRVDSLNKNETVYVYCKAGGRSSEAVELLKQKGFVHIVELQGGIDAWNEAGKPLIK